MEEAIGTVGAMEHARCRSRFSTPKQKKNEREKD